MHSEVRDLASRHDLLLGQFRHRNVHVAADQGAEQKQQRGARTNADADVGITQNSQMNEQDEQYKQSHQNGKERRAKGQIVKLARGHRWFTMDLRCADHSRGDIGFDECLAPRRHALAGRRSEGSARAPIFADSH